MAKIAKMNLLKRNLPIPEHKDILGKTVNVGDVVAANSNNSMFIAVVTKLNPRMVQIKKISGHSGWKTNKYSKDLVVLNSEDVTMYLLKKGNYNGT